MDDAATPSLPLRPGPDQQPLAQRYRGCLLGGAVGDALGAPVEFMSLSDIRRRFGPEGIKDYAPAYGRLGAITDDTQMTLFTADGLMRAWVRKCLKGIGPIFVGVTANAYLRWLRTQGHPSPRGVEVVGREPGFVMSLRELHSPRAPGNTCLAALEAMTAPVQPAKNDSKGCGGVMRVAPVALFMHRIGHADPIPYGFRLACDLAGLTHGHPTGKLAAGAFAAMLMAILQGADLQRAATLAMDLLRAEEGGEETLWAMTNALRLAELGGPADHAIRELGEGWIAEEALAIALYCALTARDFESGIVAAVNHDGDSDSTGSIAGNLLGALYGEEAIPARWLEPLELREKIAAIADDLFMCPEWGVSEYDDGPVTPYYWRRYPGY